MIGWYKTANSTQGYVNGLLFCEIMPTLCGDYSITIKCHTRYIIRDNIIEAKSYANEEFKEWLDTVLLCNNCKT